MKFSKAFLLLLLLSSALLSLSTTHAAPKKERKKKNITSLSYQVQVTNMQGLPLTGAKTRVGKLQKEVNSDGISIFKAKKGDTLFVTKDQFITRKYALNGDTKITLALKNLSGAEPLQLTPYIG